MADIFEIAGRVHSTSQEGVTTVASEILDESKGKKQSQVNAETDATLAEHTSTINGLNSQNYVTVTATEQTTTVTDVLPVTGEADTVYRVGNWDGSQYDETCYSEYSWNGSAYVHLSTKTQIGEVFDISAYHATGGTLATYADLAAALDSNNGGGVPQSLQKGGMSVKFVQSSDNKYVQYRCMAQNFTTDVTQWQGADSEITNGSINLAESGAVAVELQKINGNIYKEGYYLDNNGNEVINTYTAKSAVSDFIEILPNTQYSFQSGFTTSNLKNDAKIVLYKSDKTKRDYYSLDSSGSVTFTTSSNAAYIRLSYNPTFSKEAKLETGEDIVWQKYDNSIAQVAKNKEAIDAANVVIEINSASIQAINEHSYLGNMKEGYYLDSDGNEVASNAWAISDYIPVTANTDYIYASGFRAGNSSRYAIVYDANKNILNNFQVSYGDKDLNTGANAAYIRLSIYISTVSNLAYFKQGDTIIWEPKLSASKRMSRNTTNISDNKSVIEQLRDNTWGNIVKRGYYLDSDGNEVEDANYGITDYIPIFVPSASSIFTWRTGRTTASSVAKLILYNASKVKQNFYSDNAEGSSFTIYQYNSIIYIRLSVYLGSDNAYLKQDGGYIWQPNKGWDIPTLKETVEKLDKVVGGNVAQYGAYFDNDGSLVSDVNYGISDFIEIGVYSNTYIYNLAYTDNKCKIITYDTNKTYKTYYAANEARSYAYGTKYIRVSFRLNDLNEAVFKNITSNTILWKRIIQVNEFSQQLANDIITLEKTASYTILKDDIISAIKAYRNKVCRLIDNKSLTFGFLTDVHLTSSGDNQHLRRLYTMAKYAKSSPCKFQLFGGDMVSGEDTIALDMETMLNGKESFRDNLGLPAFIVRGNHDGGHKTWKSIVDGGGHPTQEQTINNMDWYNMMVSSLDDVVMDENNPLGGYYYKDFENEKIRLIVLNVYDMQGTDIDGNSYNAMWSLASIRQAEATWLVNKALDFTSKGSDKTNWGIIVCSHDGVDADNYMYGDGNEIESLLQAFKNGGQYTLSYSYNNDPNYTVNLSADFTSQGSMKYLAYIHGHTHTDRVLMRNGVPHISTGCARISTTEDVRVGATLALPRTVGTVSEYLWDTLAVGDNLISALRFGAVESGKTSGDRFIHIGANNVAVGNNITLTPTKVAGTLTWGIYSVSPGYYVPYTNGVAGTPVGTETVKASISNGVVTGIATGSATAFAQDEDGNKEFFGIVVTN